MSFLMRAPRECASWTWDLEGVTEAGMESVLAVAEQMSGVLRKHGLLDPGALEWSWFQVGKGGLGLHSRLSLVSRSLAEPTLAEEMRACRPVGHPQAEMGAVTVFGDGEWIDAGGRHRREYRLVELMVSPGNLGPYAELSVHHDVWGECDFRGRPHPAVHANNAPRLAAALQELDGLLGVEAEPGGATYFGKAEGYGLEAPELIDGLGPDLTDGIGGIVTSGVPDKWCPRTLPVDRKAADRLGAWAAASGREALDAVSLDLRGADLSGGDFTGAWFTHAVLAGISLAGAELWRAHLEKADLTGANLSGSSLVKATLDQASLRSACLDDADLTSVSLADVDAAGATFRRTDLTNATLLQVDLRGADLSGATTANTSFTVHVDDRTLLRGLTGTLLGPVTVVTGDTERELDGLALQRWLTERGADVEVLSGFTYYARFDESSTSSRENPYGIVRRSTVDAIDIDEAFTRNLRWEPTEYLRLYYLGHNDDDHAEITRAEADAFIKRVTRILTTPRARATVERLTAIDWRDEDTAFTHAASRSRLFREHLRRSALWAQAYQPAGDWPVVDLAASIDPTVQVEAELTARLDAFLEANVGDIRAKALCRAALRWAALLDTTTARLPELDDPYEPLLLMLERGGWCGLVIKNRVADFSIVRVPLGTWQDHLSTEPVVSLDKSALDAIG
ncbi:pentapeptide repeat-containing protein [Streptomyces kaniharaensis]|uniref:pentapeptide repeat-containing protein n=1 Tax=Streptomyces kaniharaensis TaxID=212423 RepID=UPI002DDD9CBE|nr:pentapeptide repeat-containing protein [Streptomyces kaniharaensis]